MGFCLYIKGFPVCGEQPTISAIFCRRRRWRRFLVAEIAAEPRGRDPRRRIAWHPFRNQECVASATGAAIDFRRYAAGRIAIRSFLFLAGSDRAWPTGFLPASDREEQFVRRPASCFEIRPDSGRVSPDWDARSGAGFPRLRASSERASVAPVDEQPPEQPAGIATEEGAVFRRRRSFPHETYWAGCDARSSRRRVSKNRRHLAKNCRLSAPNRRIQVTHYRLSGCAKSFATDPYGKIAAVPVSRGGGHVSRFEARGPGRFRIPAEGRTLRRSSRDPCRRRSCWKA